MNQKIFKAYDIRGLCPGELDADTAFRVGQAVVIFTKAKTVVVGRDMRATSLELKEALVRGILSQGADVVDVGRVTTPMFYFAVGEYDLHDAGVMVTASHNPKEYNGLKLSFGDVLPIGANTGMNDVRDLALAGPHPTKPEGNVVESDVRASYLERLFSVVKPGAVRPLKVVLDGGNGMAGEIIGDVFAQLPQVEMQGMYLEPDGSFPNHEANPLKTETLNDLRSAVVDTHADVGFAYDGDSDRVGLVDELGEPVPGDLMLALLAGDVLRREPGATIAYTVNSSMSVEEAILAGGGRPLMVPVGHGIIKPIMRKENIALAGEISFHFYFRDFYWGESTDLVTLLVLEMMSRTGKTVSELFAPLRRYFASGEINSEVEDKDGVIARLKKEYASLAGASVSEIDGLRIDYRFAERPQDNWWFNVRASNTEPLLRLNLETTSRERTDSLRDELLKKIRS